MKKIFNNNKAYTLIELIISLGIFSILAILILSVYMFSINTYNNSQRIYTSQSYHRYAMDMSLRFIRNATNLEIMSVESAKEEILQNSNYNYLLIEDGNLNIYIRNSQSYDQYVYAYNLDDSESSFIKQEDYVLILSLKTTSQNQSFTKELNILLINMKLNNNSITGTQGNALKFLQPK